MKLENPALLALLVILIYSVSIGIGSFNYHKIGGWGVETDFYWDFAPAAQELQRFEFNVDHYQFRGPGYPLLLAAVDTIIPDTVDAARWLGLLSAAISLWLCFLIISKLLDDWWGLWMVIALALNPLFIEYTYTFGTDMPYLALTALFLFAISSTQTKYTTIAAGAIAGFAFLTRYNGAAYLLVGMVWAWLSCGEGKRVRFMNIAQLAGGAAIILLPWFILLAIKTGNPFYNLNYQNIAYELYAKDKMTWDAFWYSPEGAGVQSLGSIVRNDLWTLTANLFGNIWEHAIRDAKELLGWTMWICSIGGLMIVSTRRVKRDRAIWIALTGIISFAMLCLVFYSARFSMCVLPVYFTLAALFLNEIPTPGAAKWWKASIKPGLVAAYIIVLLQAPANMAIGLKELKNVPLEVLEFTSRVELQNLQPGKITDRKPHIPYYLGQSFVPMPNYPTVDELVDWMQEEGVDYLSVHEGIAFVRPRLYALFQHPEMSDKLSPILIKPDKPKMGVWQLIDPK